MGSGGPRISPPTSFGMCSGAKGTVTAFSPSFESEKEESGRDKNETSPLRCRPLDRLDSENETG